MEIKTSSLTSLVLFLLSPSPKPVLGVGTLDIENCREASRSSCTEEELDEEDVPDPVEEESQDVPLDPVDAPEEAPEVKKKKEKKMFLHKEEEKRRKYSSAKEERKGITR